MPTEENCLTCRFADFSIIRPECSVCIHRAFAEGLPHTGWTPVEPAPEPSPRPELPDGWLRTDRGVSRAPSAWVDPDWAVIDDAFAAAEFLEIIRAAVHVGLVTAEEVNRAIKP